MPVSLHFGPKPAKKLWIGLVDHECGTNIYVGATRAQVIDEIASYCEEWWADENIPGSPIEFSAAEDIVLHYFDHVSSNESWQTQEVDLPAGL